MIYSRRRFGAELVAFGALAGFAGLRWAGLLEPLPGRMLFAFVVVSLVLALILTGISRAGFSRPAETSFALLVLGACSLAGMLIAGVPLHLALPPGWDDLVRLLGDGLAGVGRQEIPYEGPAGDWTRTGLLLAVPLGLLAAAAFAFWPSGSRPGRHGELRPVGLAILITLYGVAVTWQPPGSEIVWGLPLLALVAAWIWLPRIEPGHGGAAFATVAIAALIALPLAGWANTGRALFDYDEWRLFGGQAPASFNWDHGYGPLDWPEEGSEVLRVSDAGAPHFWRSAVLDTFDGEAWADPPDTAPASTSEVFGDPVAAANVRVNQEWLDSIDIEITGLETQNLIIAGSAQWVLDAGVEPPSVDGTIPILGEPLGEGDEYSAEVYDPQPKPADLRNSAAPMPPGLDPYRTLTLDTATGGTEVVTTPDWIPGGSNPALETTVAGTPYAGVYELARSLTAESQTRYDAVAAIGDELTTGAYLYSREPEDVDDPLAAFLLETKEGYCQQFSGAMALMLRMIGIPARVAAGFATGRRVDTGGSNLTFSVRDTDAHSWVEVYFPAFGWVTFDPTPAGPSEARTGGGATAFDLAGNPLNFGAGNPELAQPDEETTPPGEKRDEKQAAQDQGRQGQGSTGVSAGVPAAVWITLGLLLAAFALLALVSVARRRRMLADRLGSAQAAELAGALRSLGWDIPAGATLLELERVLGGIGPEAKAYAARLRRCRYAAGAARPPGPRDRRRLRAALVRDESPLVRLRALLAIPPGGPAGGASASRT